MILGIDLGGTSIRIAQIVDGEIADKSSAASPANLNLTDSIEYLKNFIERLFTNEVTSICIGVPSVLDMENGIVYNVANIPSWKEVHLKQILESKFHVPVYINNDSNCFALGEQRFGRGRCFKNLVGITLGTGVGAGVIINGVLYNGNNTCAGEIGSLLYLDATYERYCSSEFFSYYGLTGLEASRRAEQKDPKALNLWAAFGTHIGQLIQASMFIYDPDAIILGGGLANAFTFFSKTMHDTILSFPYPASLANLQLAVSTNSDIALLGASALIPVEC